MKTKQLELIVPQLPKDRAFVQFFCFRVFRSLMNSSCDVFMNIGPVVDNTGQHTCITIQALVVPFSFSLQQNFSYVLDFYDAIALLETIQPKQNKKLANST